MAYCDKDCFHCKLPDCYCPEAECVNGINTDIYIRATRIAPKHAWEDLTPLEQERRLRQREASKRWREKHKAEHKGEPRRRGRPPKPKEDNE